MGVVFTIFDLGEKYVIIFDGDNIDFVKEGFVIFSDDLMAVFD